MLIRCWPGITNGLRGRLLSRFFLWSVFLTHSLTVCERGDFYRLLGMDPILFDEEVMLKTNHSARQAFPVVFDLQNSDFLFLRNRLVNTFREMRLIASLPLDLGQRLHLWRLRGRFALLLLHQFCQPMVTSTPVNP